MSTKTSTRHNSAKSAEELKARRKAAHRKKMERRAEGQKRNLPEGLILMPIPGIESHYLAGSDGHVYTLKTYRKRIGRNSNKGYPQVTISIQNKITLWLVHRLIASAFHGQPKGLEVNHKNGVKDDNRPENLEWVTRSENHIHAYKTGLKGKNKITS